MKSFMTRLWTVVVVLGIGLLIVPDTQPTPITKSDEAVKIKSAGIEEATKVRLKNDYGKLPLYFIQNDGQVDGKVRFYEKGSGHATFFTKEGVYLTLNRKRENKNVDNNTLRPFSLNPPLVGRETR